MTVQQSYLQPHEGVRGEERPEDPVLTMTPAQKRILAIAVKELWRASLVNAPSAQERFDRMTHPRPGDYVVVGDILSGWMHRDGDNFDKGVGIFLGDRDEWWTTDEQWARDKAEDGTLTDADRMVDHAWYVQYLPDASVCRWVNCDVLAIPGVNR